MAHFISQIIYQVYYFSPKIQNYCVMIDFKVHCISKHVKCMFGSHRLMLGIILIVDQCVNLSNYVLEIDMLTLRKTKNERENGTVIGITTNHYYTRFSFIEISIGPFQSIVKCFAVLFRPSVLFILFSCFH